MEYSTTAPIWLQVATAIKADIASGRLQAGEKLPGGREMAVQFSINPNTAARVYRELEEEGLCETRRGLGTFVSDDTARLQTLRREMARDAIGAMLKKLAPLGLTRADAVRLLQSEEDF